MNKLIFFRDDDVHDCDSNFKKFLGFFLWHKIPVHLAVIPGNLTTRCRTFLRQCLKKYPQLIEIGQHGYRHLNYSSNIMEKYEFGEKRTYTQQRKDIAKGKDILSKITKEDLIFTPPWHGFDDNTLRIISELGFSGMSLDRKSKIPGNDFSVIRILTSAYLNKKDIKGWFVEKSDVLLSEIRAVKDKQAGVLIHHDRLKTDQDFRELSDLLSKLKRIPGVQFCKLSQCLTFF